MSSCILTGSIQTTPQVSSGDSEAKPLIFTFVPTVRRLPTHSQLADTSKFLVKIPEEPSDKNPETVNRSNFNEYLTVNSGSQPERDQEISTYPSGIREKISQGRGFKANKPQGMQQSDLFKAEYVFIVDSEGEDEAINRKGEQSPPSGMGTTATRPKSLAITSSLVSDVVRPKTRGANLQAPSHPEMPHGIAPQQKHGQLTSSSTTSEQLACKPPTFSFVSPTNQTTPPDPVNLGGASVLEQLHSRQLDVSGALVEETATYFQTSAHSSPLSTSKGNFSTVQFPHSTQLSGSNLSSPSATDQKPGPTSEVLRKTTMLTSHALSPRESPRTSSSPLSDASVKSNPASYIPVRIVMYSLSPSPKPFTSSFHGSSSTICSQVSSSGNLSKSGVKSPVPSRLSLLTAILKSDPSHQRPFSPASCPTFSLNSLASSTLTLDQKVKQTPPTPKKSLSSCSLRAGSPEQREYQVSDLSQQRFHLPFFTESAPLSQALSPSPTKHVNSSLVSLNVEKTPSPTLKTDPMLSSLQTKTLSPIGLPPVPPSFSPLSWKGKRDTDLRGPEKPRNIYTYPSTVASSTLSSVFPTNQRATLSAPEKCFHPSPALSNLMNRSQKATPQLSGQGQKPSLPPSPPISLPKLGSPPLPHANLPTQAFQLSPSALHPNCGNGILPSRRGKSESSISDHMSSVSTPSPPISLTRTKELISPCALSMSTGPENKKPKQYKTKSSYKAFAAIPTNTLLLEQKALDEPAKTESVSKDNTLGPPLEFCFPAQLRQQTEELCATIDKVLQDSLSMHSSDSPSSSLQTLLSSDTVKTPTTLPRAAGRETKYANLSSPSSTVSESQLTKPGVIRPVPVKSKILLKKEEEVYEPNPFSKYLEDNNDIFSEQGVTIPHKPVSLHPLYQTRLYPPAKSLLHPQTLSHADCLTPGPFSHLSSFSLTDEQENSHTPFSHNAYNKRMWIGYKILIVSHLITEIWAEKQYLSQREVDPGADFTRNHTILEGTRFKRAIYKGQYCRSFGCCEDRDDSCVTQFYEVNALCYCDTFCERENSDCCPDYKSFCRGEKEWLPHTTPWYTEGCLRDGQHYEEGSVVKENCNSCTCSGQQWKCSQHVCLVEPELIDHVNKGDYGWTAQNYSQFWGMTLEEGFKYRLGTLPPSPMLLSMNEVTAVPAIIDLPEFFVAYYKWPGWTHGPLDQKNCAASWAFSTASVAADRIAIQSKGRYTANLSPQNLISCCAKNHHGCSSGSIDRAWWYLRKRGLVSHACYPFLKDQNTTNNACAMASRSDGRGKRHATKPCPNNIEKSNRIYQCSPPYRVSSNETEIMKEIIHNGPVQAIMQVHEDFFHYKSGIYRHVTSTNEKSEKYRKLQTHAVKLTGWGTLRGAQGRKEKFWIVANSWGNSWGENGYFRILRGVNESDIEKLIIAAWGQPTSSDEP